MNNPNEAPLGKCSTPHERRDQTERGRAIRELFEHHQWCHNNQLKGYALHAIAMAYDRGAQDKERSMLAEMQRAIDSARGGP